MSEIATVGLGLNISIALSTLLIALSISRVCEQLKRIADAAEGKK